MQRIEFSSVIPAPLEEVWKFFIYPGNLNRLTPPEMRFEILTPVPDSMYEGMLISYRVSPFRGMRVSWLTEITKIAEGSYFIDEQRKGPYRIWHHEHHFISVAGGVKMVDILTYDLPFGWAGQLADAWLVKPRVREIFRFREDAIAGIFQPV